MLHSLTMIPNIYTTIKKTQVVIILHSCLFNVTCFGHAFVFLNPPMFHSLILTPTIYIGIKKEVGVLVILHLYLFNVTFSKTIS